MKSFDYRRPLTLQGVSDALRDSGARPLAGGMSLIPTLKQRLADPPLLVDLGAVAALRGIRVGNGSVTIGATTRHVQVERSPELHDRLPALAALAASIGDPQVRNRGTLGGSIANADPAADYPAALLALGATVHTDRRAIPAHEFFVDLFEVALQAGEIVTAVEFPLPRDAAYEKFRNCASRYALAGVFVARCADGVRVAVTGAAPCVFRATAFETPLNERFSAQAIADVRQSAEGLFSDIHADADYRAHLVGVLARRAVARLLAAEAAR